MSCSLTQYGQIGGKHPRGMGGHLTHVKTGIVAFNWIYVQTPIVRVLVCHVQSGITTVRHIANGQQGDFVDRTTHPHHLVGIER
jgi:hypothetical protein